MKLEDIKDEHGIIDYIDGCLNDMEGGVSDKDETSWNLILLIEWVVKKDRRKQIDDLKKVIATK